MWPDRVSNPGPLTYESGALPTALRRPAVMIRQEHCIYCGYLEGDGVVEGELMEKLNCLKT